MKLSKWVIISFLILTAGILIVYLTKEKTKSVERIEAETTGGSPESGATSKLKQAYDFLESKGTNYGDSQPDDWIYPSYGTYWNRILYSASWEPNGTATESDVLSGKTFYSGSNNRVQKTGTAEAGTYPGSYFEQFVQYDDGHASDYTGEESTWINTNSSSGNEVWYDTRTQLYWARSQPTTLTNSFSSPSTGSCDFFNTGTYPTRGSYGTSGTDPACGNAINACAILSLASNEGESADTDWYLPSQKELKQAYRDGMYNQTTAAFTTTSYYWSSTEDSASSSYAWYESLGNGYANSSIKPNPNAVRCVRRD